MTATALVLVVSEGGVIQDTINLFGEVDTILLDWDEVDQSGSVSLDDAMEAIARYKVALFPWREQVPQAWQSLLETERGWLEGAESDARLTYHKEVTDA